MKEKWLPILEHEGYLVSNLGMVKSISRTIYRVNGVKVTLSEKILKPGKSKLGYCYVFLDNKSCKYVHRLVATAFLKMVIGKNYVNHKDFNPSNNCVNNLEWCSHKENCVYTFKHDRHQILFGEQSGRAKLTENNVFSIVNEYKHGEVGYLRLAKKYHISTSTVRQIISKKNWKHLWTI